MSRNLTRTALLIAGCTLFVALVSWRAGAKYLEIRAEDHLWSGDPSVAVEAFVRAVRWNPFDPEVLIGQADALFERGERAELGDAARNADLERAIGVYRLALRRAPGEPYAWAQLGRAYAALAVSRRAARALDISQLLTAPDLQEPADQWAVAALRRSVDLEPNNYDFINFTGDLLHARGEPEALDWYRRGTRTLPKILRHPYLEDPLVPQEVVDAAVQGAREAVGTGNVIPDFKILEEVALFFAGRRDYQGALAANADAIALLASVRADHPSLAWLWNRQGVWLEQAGDREGARAALREALDLNPHRASAHFALGRLDAADGDLEGAIERFRLARNQVSTDLRFQMTLARTLESAARLDDAAREYERALRLDGGAIPASRALVELYRRQGIYDLAIEHARRLVELQPEEPAFRRQLADLRARLQF